MSERGTVDVPCAGCGRTFELTRQPDYGVDYVCQECKGFRPGGVVPGPQPTIVDIDHLRAVAETADRDGRPWAWKGEGDHGYPQRIVRVGDAVLMAECYDDPDTPDPTAEFIATFDPPTVLALLDAAVEDQEQP